MPRPTRLLRAVLPLLGVLALALGAVAAAAFPERPAWLGGGDAPDATVARGAPAPPATRDAPVALGAGPSGSAPVPLARWRYRADPGDDGRRHGWHDGFDGGREVTVPHAPNARPVTGRGAARAYAGSVGWYARAVDVPVAGRYAVRFASAHHRAVVWVDGRRVREHVGAYDPFSARADLGPGRHRVVVRVDWRGPERQARTGWARAWFNFGGLNRPVTLERLGPSSIGALQVRTRLLRGGRARVDVTVRVANRASARSVALDATLRRAGATHRLLRRGREGSGLVRLPDRGDRHVRLGAVLDRPPLWSPRRPALHTLTVAVPGEATLRRRVGLREVRVRAGRLELNRRPLWLVGAGLPPDVEGRGDAMTPADEARIVRQLRALGANATRAQMPLSDSLLRRLDAAGIFVWQQIGPFEPAGAWSATTPQALRAARDRALRGAEALQAHPSVLAWSLTNETAGQGRPDQIAWVRDLTARLHRRDPGRPVAADLWGRALPRERGPLFAGLDALGLTDYAGWYEAPGDPAAEAELTAGRVARLRALFPGKALVVTEFGAAGTDRLPADAFGGERFQAQLLARRARALAALPGLGGALAWNLRDYALRPDFRGGSVLRLRPGLRLTPGLNEKGVFDRAGRPKPALAALRRAYAGRARP